ncbi:hypothetical protein EV693_10596 [Nicoletella semolina]|uniref:Uncharacterized protein n=1 Tax=Nicoletella semolina TaxID=271160 RepID=A0A4R2N9D7_9PAST|nr:hypothetical protein [Nicoletella semolina]MDH2923791.1 hypothetical protein [Nicoletella semolina]TCP17627.1 hypothetical protein EV693_10596 [Nicoletella semolina]
MKKWLFSFSLACFCMLGYQVFRDYQIYRTHLAHIDVILSSPDSERYYQNLTEQNIALTKLIQYNENRLLPNFWQEWYLWRKLSILPILQQPDRHQEMLSLSYKMYEKTNKNFYLWTYCLLLERVEKADLDCYRKSLMELKKQKEYFTRAEYWLMATAVNDVDLELNKSRLLSEQNNLIELVLQDRKQTLRNMFP